MLPPPPTPLPDIVLHRISGGLQSGVGHAKIFHTGKRKFRRAQQQHSVARGVVYVTICWENMSKGNDHARGNPTTRGRYRTRANKHQHHQHMPQLQCPNVLNKGGRHWYGACCWCPPQSHGYVSRCISHWAAERGCPQTGNWNPALNFAYFRTTHTE